MKCYIDMKGSVNKMKVMFIAYHDVNIEARTDEILKCVERLGDAYFVSYSEPKRKCKATYLETGNGIRGYLTFIRDAIKYFNKIKPDVLVLHDNYTAIILLKILFSKKKPYVIYDSSELYIDIKAKNIKELKSRFLQLIENRVLKFADLIIAANVERATIMKDFFKLKEIPLVFDNIHKIEEKYDEVKCKQKYSQYLSQECFLVFYAGGISKQRMTYELADAVGKLGNKFKLIISGFATEKEIINFNKYITDKKYNNIIYIGFLSRGDLRYLLSQVHINVSAFQQHNLNNKYCASGKLYEGLFENKPVLVTDNPPLKRICDKYKIGISTNDFYNGLIELERNYKYYYKNVKKYIRDIEYNSRIEKLKMDIEKRLEYR